MSKLLNYSQFISENNSSSEHNTDNVNESVYTDKTLMEYVHSEMYNKLVKRILGTPNTDLNTIITPENGTTNFKAKDVFNPMWNSIEKYTNPNYTDFPASVLKELENEYRTDKNILDSISIPNIGSESYVMASASENLKNPSNVVKLLSENKLVDLLKSKGIFDKLNSSQRDVFEKISNKTKFIQDLKSSLTSRNFDPKLGLSPDILSGYSNTPGFKISKGSSSSFDSNNIGNYIIRDISLLAYKYYVEGLSEIISENIIEDVKSDDKKATTDVSVDTKPKSTSVKTRRASVDAPSTTSFNPDNLKNFGY